MNNFTKKEISKYQKQVISQGLDKKTLKFLKESKEFLEKNNIKPKPFSYQSGLSFISKEKFI